MNQNIIQEANDILERLLMSSLAMAGDALQYEENNTKKSIRSLIWETQDLIKRYSGIPELVFLQLPLLEQTFRKTYPLMLVSVQALFEHKTDPIKDISRLLQIFEENPTKAIWEKRAKEYADLLSKIGIPLNYEDYQDLTAIAEPLLDAFSFWKKDPVLPQYKSGKSGTGTFKILSTVSKFHKESEILDTVEQVPFSRMICFAAMEHLCADYTDALQEYINGYPNEHQRNTIQNNHITKEEYLASPNIPSRTIYLVIKDGDNIYLKLMPYQTGGYGVRSKQDKYYYGRRAGYAPYEIFYIDIPPADPDNTLPVMLQTSYSLNDLMDDESRIWLPAFLSETIKYMDNKEKQTEEILLPDKIKLLPDVKQTTLPVPYVGIQIPELHTLLKDNNLIQLANLIGITQSDFEQILPEQLFPTNKCISKNNLAKKMEDRKEVLRKAALCLLADQVSDFIKEHYKETFLYISKNLPNQDTLLKNTLDGTYKSFTTIRVEGSRRKDDRGNDIIEHLRSVYFYDEILKCDFLTTETGINKPGILFTVQPHKTEEYAAFLGKTVHDLPVLLKNINLFHYFCNVWEQTFNFWNKHDIISNRDVNKPDAPCFGKKGIYISDLYVLYIGFSKSYFRKHFPDLKYMTKDPVFRTPN